MPGQQRDQPEAGSFHKRSHRGLGDARATATTLMPIESSPGSAVTRVGKQSLA